MAKDREASYYPNKQLCAPPVVEEHRESPPDIFGHGSQEFLPAEV